MDGHETGWVATMVLCGAWLLTGSGCGDDARERAGVRAERLPVVEVTAVEEVDLSRRLAVTGEVVARQSVVVSPTVEGPIASLPWHEGDRVERGDVLVEIDRPLYRAERNAAAATVKVAEAQLADLRAGAREEEIEEARATVQRLDAATVYARSTLDRTRRLVEVRASPAEALERADANHAQTAAELKAARQRLKALEAGPTPTAVATAEAQIAEARAHLQLAEERIAECRITAPFDGVISRRHMSIGDMASPREPLLEMYDPTSMVVRFAVPEWATGAVESEQTVKVRFDALGQQSFDGRIVRVFTHLEVPTRTRTVEAVVESGVDLLPGMFTRLDLTLALVRDALVVPTDAVLARPGEGRMVMVVREGKAERISVSIGIQQEGRSQVYGDLHTGDTVIVFGQEALEPGAAVQVRRQSESPADQPSGSEP